MAAAVTERCDESVVPQPLVGVRATKPILVDQGHEQRIHLDHASNFGGVL